jgi:hypothetical protein
MSNYNLRKRKTDQNLDCGIKKQKTNLQATNHEIWKVMNYMRPHKIPKDRPYDPESEYVSATRIRNYLLRDPIIDWLELYYTDLGYNNEENNLSKDYLVEEKVRLSGKNNEHLDILFSMGNKFESEVCQYLKNKFGSDMVKVCYNRNDYKNRDKVLETLKYMNQGIPIIEQAMVCNEENKTFGAADLLVRSDYLNKLVSTNVNISNNGAKFLKNAKNYHYVVIDIKWSTLPLCANEDTILNCERYYAYKGQLAIYNLAVGMMQGYIPNQAYILGKAWKKNSSNSQGESGYSCFDRLGIIDYTGFDSDYIETTADAISWIRDVRFIGHEWDILNPHREELYPNMCNMGDTKWDPVKSKIAKLIKELTQLWMVGQKNRDYSLDHKIDNWNHNKCSAKNLNINGKIVAPILDKIIIQNRNPDKVIIPDKIKDNTNNWQIKSKLDFYVDFETINESFIEREINLTNSKNNTNVTFMIGVGYIVKDNFEYKEFTMKYYNIEEEKRIFNEFFDFIAAQQKKYKKDQIRLFHWATAEKTFIEHANRRHNYIWDNSISKLNLIDMCKIFTKEPIVVSGMLKFKLKEVAKAMYNHKLIQTNWETADYNDGLTAMIQAVKYYSNKDTNSHIMQSIIDYNYIDCRVLWEIVDYLRKNHI